MKNYKDPTVKIIAFSARDVITTSGGTDTTTPEGGNLLGGSSSPAKSAAPTNLGIGGSQQ